MGWQSRPIFISSTFADMQAERDHLRAYVFPALEERLKAQRRHLEWVDLRLGVATASEKDVKAREEQVLKVCLAEVRRCRPFLIVLLGDRYGWVPEPERIAAAAAEAGFTAEIAGRSVTDLEIRYGALAEAAEQSRCFFYFRDPLPYDQMPRRMAALYSDAYDGGPGSAERCEKLDKLKEEIESAFPQRVKPLRVGWDREKKRVSAADLEVWGRQVVDDIWSDLEAVTASEAIGEPASWQEAERIALDDYIEDRARDFVGRDAVLARLQELAASPAEEGEAWGLVLTGAAGAGKSAVFGELHRRLKQSGAVVLAHAAGASPRSPHVNNMLLRWIEELCAVLDITPGLAETADSETIEAAFQSLLGRVAAERRVVLLIDALDQFEETTRARFMTWLPRLWPVNARLIATAIPSEASKALAERPGAGILSLPPLDAPEARRIAEGICARYHRTLEPEVFDALLARRDTDGPAWGNTLWLVLAVEELNLVDADDFDRARRVYKGSSAEQLRALMLDIVAALPSDIIGLYGATFDRAEKLYGRSLARAFVATIAVCWGGWRESDFRVLLPRLAQITDEPRPSLLRPLLHWFRRPKAPPAGEPWDELRFASLRRLFRGQIRQRGRLGRWTFNHAQMRRAAQQKLVEQGIAQTRVHAAVADHLLALPADDPLRMDETMLHLLGGQDWAKTARFYGDLSLTRAEIDSATLWLATAAVEAGANPNAPHHPRRLLNEAAHFLDNGEAGLCGNIARRFLFELFRKLNGYATLEICTKLIGQTGELLNRLANADPAAWQRDLLASRSKMGDLLLVQGNLKAALDAYQSTLAISERRAKADPENADCQHDLCHVLQRVAEVKISRGDRSAALVDLQRGREIMARLVKACPTNVQWQGDLAVCLTRIGSLFEQRGNLPAALDAYRAGLAIRERLAEAAPRNPAYQQDVSASQTSIADVLAGQGDLTAAIEAHRTALAIAERLANTAPDNAGLQQGLALSHMNVGDVLAAQGNLLSALDAHQTSRDILERLVKVDPGNSGCQLNLSGAHSLIGNILFAQGNLPGALESYQTAHDILERLTKADPENREWQHSLSVVQMMIGKVLVAQGKLPLAHDAFQASVTIRQRIVEVDAGNSGWQHDLAAARSQIGDILVSQGNLPAALDAYQAALAIDERLAKADPTNTGWQRELSISQDRIGDILLAQGDLPAALESFQAALATDERLARADPANAGWQNGLSVTRSKIGDVLLAQGNLPAALDAYQSSRDILEHLSTAAHGGVEWQRNLAVSQNKIGEVLRAQGDLPAALDAHRAALVIAERLTKTDPTHTGWRCDLAASQDGIGMVLQAQGSLPAALDAYQAAFATRERLAEADPGNAEWQRNLSISLNKIGDVLGFQGNLPAGLDAYQASLAIAERLAAAAPANARWQRDLSIPQERIGDVLQAQGNLPAALDAYQAVLATRERLARTDPGNAEWQHDVAISLQRTGEIAAQQGRRADALADFRRGLEIMRRLTALAPDHAVFKRTLAWFEAKLAAQ